MKLPHNFTSPSEAYIATLSELDRDTSSTPSLQTGILLAENEYTHASALLESSILQHHLAYSSLPVSLQHLIFSIKAAAREQRVRRYSNEVAPRMLGTFGHAVLWTDVMWL